MSDPIVADSETAIAQLWQQFAAQPAQLDKDRMLSLEERIDSDGVARRQALATLCLSGEQLVEMFGSKADRSSAADAAQFIVGLREYGERLQALSSLMTTARARLVMALTDREDCTVLLAEADA